MIPNLAVLLSPGGSGPALTLPVIARVSHPEEDLALLQIDLSSLQVLEVRVAGDPGAQIPGIERLVASVAPELPVFDVSTMKQGRVTYGSARSTGSQVANMSG